MSMSSSVGHPGSTIISAASNIERAEVGDYCPWTSLQRLKDLPLVGRRLIPHSYMVLVMVVVVVASLQDYISRVGYGLEGFSWSSDNTYASEYQQMVCGCLGISRLPQT